MTKTRRRLDQDPQRQFFLINSSPTLDLSSLVWSSMETSWVPSLFFYSLFFNLLLGTNNNQWLKVFFSTGLRIFRLFFLRSLSEHFFPDFRRERNFLKLFAEDGKAETVRVSAHRGAVRHSYRRRWVCAPLLWHWGCIQAFKQVTPGSNLGTSEILSRINATFFKIWANPDLCFVYFLFLTKWNQTRVRTTRVGHSIH